MKAAEKKQKRADQQVAILDKRGAQLQNAADKQVAILDKSGSLLNQMAKMREAKLKKKEDKEKLAKAKAQALKGHMKKMKGARVAKKEIARLKALSADELEEEETMQSHERALELAKQKARSDKVSAQKETEAAVATEEAGEEGDAPPYRKRPATWKYEDSAKKRASYANTWKHVKTLYR